MLDTISRHTYKSFRRIHMLESLHKTGTRLVQLRDKLNAREGISEYEKNCEAIRAEIARLEQAPEIGNRKGS